MSNHQTQPGDNIILDVDDLQTRFHIHEGIVHAVNGVSFSLKKGETLGIVGESGSGKSVSMMSLLKLLPQPPARIASGSAFFYDQEEPVDLLTLSGKEMNWIRGSRIGMIFQDPLSSLNPLLTVGRQITESLQWHKNMKPKEAEERCIDLLEDVGISGAKDRYKNYPHQFSGGMRQRVMIAIAIACSPGLVIADEPTTALDVTVQAQIIELMARLQKRMGISVVWISHDLGVVAGLADRVMVMYGGFVAECAPVEQLYADPRHPYTRGLLGALPRLDRRNGRKLESIEGTPPNLLNEPKHCQFVWRCKYAFDRCRQEIPPLYNIGPEHTCACFYDITNMRPRNE